MVCLQEECNDSEGHEEDLHEGRSPQDVSVLELHQGNQEPWSKSVVLAHYLDNNNLVELVREKESWGGNRTSLIGLYTTFNSQKPLDVNHNLSCLQDRNE